MKKGNTSLLEVIPSQFSISRKYFDLKSSLHALGRDHLQRGDVDARFILDEDPFHRDFLCLMAPRLKRPCTQEPVHFGDGSRALLQAL